MIDLNPSKNVRLSSYLLQEELLHPVTQMTIKFITDLESVLVDEDDFTWNGESNWTKIIKHTREYQGSSVSYEIVAYPKGCMLDVKGVLANTNQLIAQYGLVKDPLFENIPLMPLKGVKLYNYIQKQKMWAYEEYKDQLKNIPLLHLGEQGLYSKTLLSALNTPATNVDSFENQDILYYEQDNANVLGNKFPPQDWGLQEYYKMIFTGALILRSMERYKLGGLYTFSGIPKKQFLCMKQITQFPEQGSYAVETTFMEVNSEL